MKLKKAHLVYFVQKESPKRMDYRFGYQRTPEFALLFQLGQVDTWLKWQAQEEASWWVQDPP